MLLYLLTNLYHMSSVKAYKAIYLCFPGCGKMGCIFERRIWRDFKHFFFARLDHLKREGTL